MNIGAMRYKIVIQQVTKTKDDYGAETLVWSTYKTLKAAKKDMGGTQVLNNNEIFNTNTIELTTHYRDGINTEMRVVLNNDYYRILSIAEINYKEGLVLRCEKIND